MSDEPRDFDELMSDPNLDQKMGETELQKYAKALQQEFEKKSAVEPDNVEVYLKEFWKANVHSAAAQIVWVSNHSTSDTARLAASKFIVQEAFAEEQAGQDPVRDLLKQLAGNDKATAPEGNEKAGKE